MNTDVIWWSTKVKNNSKCMQLIHTSIPKTFTVAFPQNAYFFNT